MTWYWGMIVTWIVKIFLATLSTELCYLYHVVTLSNTISVNTRWNKWSVTVWLTLMIKSLWFQHVHRRDVISAFLSTDTDMKAETHVWHQQHLHKHHINHQVVAAVQTHKVHHVHFSEALSPVRLFGTSAATTILSFPPNCDNSGFSFRERQNGCNYTITIGRISTSHLTESCI